MISEFLGHVHTGSAGLVPEISVDGGQLDQVIATALNLPQNAFKFVIDTIANFGS